jgi:hypothetical protein
MPALRHLRTHLVPLSIGAPAVVAVLWVLAVEGYRTIAPDSFLYVEPPAASFAEALHHHEVELAYAFVKAGQDPNELISFRDPEITGDRVVEMSPLTLAVAARNRNAVMMLLSNGVRMDLPRNVSAMCLARRLGESDLERLMVRAGGVSAPCART